MRIHALTVTAFGPFAETQHVDFDRLGSGGLFLFHGPTGAGKTSILDAVCFGLYGQVPGARQQARSLRSDHAAPGARPEVCLEATVRGRRIRVTRSPQWERPKRRGSGVTTEQARVLLQDRDGDDWRTLSTRLDEGGQLLGQLLGLTMAQFCQVVLLPQGQFAEFLRADADRRRHLLESLFDTERFTGVQSWLVEQRRQSARALDAADQRVSALLARVAEAAGLADAPTVAASGSAVAPPTVGVGEVGVGEVDGGEIEADEVDPGEVPAAMAVDWADGLLSAAREALGPAEQAERVARRTRDEAARSVTVNEARHAAQLRHAALLARRAQVTAAEPAWLAAVHELDAARRAAPVVPVWAEAERLDAALAAAVGEAATRSAAIGPDLQVAAATAGAGAVRHQVATVRLEIGGLQRLAGHEDEATRLAAEVGDLERTVVALDARSAGLAEWLDTAAETRLRVEAAAADAARAEAQLPAARAAHASARARLEAGLRRDQLQDELTRLRGQLGALVDMAQSTRGRWLDLRQCRLDGMAAELAGALVAGDPCSVCGSQTHPAPAVASPDFVSREQEETAQAAADEAEAARVRHADEIAAVELSLAEAMVASDGDAPVSQLTAAEESTRRDADAVTARAQRLTDAARAVTEFEAECERRLQQRMQVADEARGAREQHAARQTRVEQLRSELASARGEDPTVRSRADRLSRLADDCDALARALTERERLQVEVRQARERAHLVATENGLTDLAAVADAARDGDRVAELDAFRVRHESERASLDQLLADPELVAAAATDPADVEAAQADLLRREDEHRSSVEARHAATRRLQALERLRDELVSALDERRPSADRHAVVDGLSRLADGKGTDNRLRMSLAAYVLAARLEQVAVAASGRLQRMSSGRYSLMHTPETSRGRGGLHLRVLDAWTGAERDPATLSGGESFSASLALALGLADVVAAEAGGSLLETLFVDEGFGSLDDETLDEVMGVLDGLRDGGRVVGIVSHVTDLRQRIPVQLRVDKGRQGSLVRQ